MKMVLIAPRKYVQGRGVMREIGSCLAAIGKRPLLLWDATVRGIVGETVTASCRGAGIDPVEVAFGGESTPGEVKRVAEEARKASADIVVGVGGGKALDTAKAAAHQTGLSMVTVPTIASNDSPTSSYTVWYDEEHRFHGFESWGRNPDLVLVDTEVIARGPLPAFISGMGDALSTWVEAEVCYKTRSVNLAGGTATLAAMAIARLGFDTLLEFGEEALRAVEAGVVTPAVEKVVEANVLHSGIGFESGGVATAHMIANALNDYPECHELMHGHKVGFGVVAQLCLDVDMEVEWMHRIVDFEVAVRLPVTFADLNLEGISRERLRPIGDVCAGEGSLCAAHNFPVTSDMIIDAMIAADRLGRERKDQLGVE
ncbi:MAG: glycerol dehydrogenase [Planctomycetes bacterium]|nr:glycerol dehydrogenase [Planctomycetota bacterium]